MAKTQSYEVVIFIKGPNFYGTEQTFMLKDADPEQALATAIRTLIRTHIREVYQVIKKPESHQPGIDEVANAITGARVYERYNPTGTIGLHSKLVVEFDRLTTCIKAKEAFNKAA